MAKLLDINIPDNEGRVDVSFFSERLMLESDMLGYGAKKAFGTCKGWNNS